MAKRTGLGQRGLDLLIPYMDKKEKNNRQVGSENENAGKSNHQTQKKPGNETNSKEVKKDLRSSNNVKKKKKKKIDDDHVAVQRLEIKEKRDNEKDKNPENKRGESKAKKTSNYSSRTRRNRRDAGDAAVEAREEINVETAEETTETETVATAEETVEAVETAREKVVTDEKKVETDEKKVETVEGKVKTVEEYAITETARNGVDVASGRSEEKAEKTRGGEAKSEVAEKNKVKYANKKLVEGNPGTKKKEITDETLMVPIGKIEPNKSQPRKFFDDDSLQELADSIRNYGIIDPLIVQRKDDYYKIIAGERRWRAARIAGLKEIPVLIREYTPKEVMEITLIENIQRQDLNPIEEAMAYRQLMDEYNLKQDELAERVSKSRAAIANSVRLLNLDERVKQMIVAQMISTGHGRALLSITDPEIQYRTAQRVFDEKLSVREIENLVKKISEQSSAKEKRHAISDSLRAIISEFEDNMRLSLATKVSIIPKSTQRGKIEIEYYSADDLERICDIIHKSQA